jgi:hypothetical protein
LRCRRAGETGFKEAKKKIRKRKKERNTAKKEEACLVLVFCMIHGVWEHGSGPWQEALSICIQSVLYVKNHVEAVYPRTQGEENKTTTERDTGGHVKGTCRDEHTALLCV